MIFQCPLVLLSLYGWCYNMNSNIFFFNVMKFIYIILPCFVENFRLAVKVVWFSENYSIFHWTLHTSFGFPHQYLVPSEWVCVLSVSGVFGSSRPHWKAVCASLISLFSLKGASRLAAVTTRTASPTQYQQPHDGTTRSGKTQSNPHTHTVSLLAHSVYTLSHLHT